MFVISRLPAPRHAGASRRALSLVAGVCLMSASVVQAQSSPPPKPPQLPPGVQGKGKLVPAKVPDSVMATMPRTIKMPTTDAGFFEQRDERARNALEFLDCLERTLLASRAGALGAVPTAASIVCLKDKDEWRGVVAEVPAGRPGIAVRTQLAMRRGGTIVSDAIDTAKVAAVMGGMRRAVDAKTPGAGVTTFMPIVVPYATFVEVLFLPVPGASETLYAGGDSVIQMAVDGSRELGHSRNAPRLTPIAVQTARPGEARFTSLEVKLPLVSELVAARALLSQYRVVRIDTKTYLFTLTRARNGGDLRLSGTWSITAR